MTYLAPYIAFPMVNPQTGYATAQFQIFWKTSLEGAEAAAVAAAAAQAAAQTAQGTAEAAQATADTKQPESISLTALAALNGTGLVEQTGANAFTDRAIGVAAPTSIPTRADADGRYVGKDGTAAPSYSAYTAPTISNPPTQAEVQGVANALQTASAALAALIVKLQAIHALT